MTPHLRLALILLPGFALAAGPDFNREIRPILSANCVHCHGPDEMERKGGKHGLRLDTEAGSRADLGDGTFAVVPGKPAQSLLLTRVRSHDADEVMPPPKSGKKLTAREIALLEQWITAGAAYDTHWAYNPPKRPTPPAVAGAGPIDAFLQSRLKTEGLKPAPEADRTTLARRVALDLTGLPPTIEEVDAFVADTAPDAYARYVDRQLAKPAYGEHWARLWMDLARYADSKGYAEDNFRSIWLYRDWIIQAFNQNQPFDRFTVEQIGGDLLPNPTESQLVATAFHRNTMTNDEGGTNDEEFRNAAVVDRVNTTFGLWMGTSMACAQCHTHKYDPITQKEYFEVFHIFNQSEDRDARDDSPVLPVLSADQAREKAGIEAEQAALEKRFDEPSPAIVAEARAWASRLAAPLEWKPAAPLAAVSAAGAKAEIQADGSVKLPGDAKTDTLTLTLPAPAGPVSALRLEALPTGHNFVLTRARAQSAPEGRDPPKARYVRVELPGKGRILHLAEVQVFSGGDNVARKGKATQKSVDFGGPPERAIDGNTDGNYDKNSVTHNKIEDDPWWEVDLGQPIPVERIVLWNRTHGTQSRLDGYRIQALDAERQPVWQAADRKGPETSDTFELDGTRDLVFADAVASFTQEGFEEALVITDQPEPKKADRKKKGPEAGWAVAPKQTEAHSLTLLLEKAVEIPAGHRLLVTLEQKSKYDQHLLRHLRVSTTGDARASEVAALPASVAGILSAARTPEQGRELARHYARELAPSLQADRQARVKLNERLAALKPATLPIMRELAAGKGRKTHVQLRGNFESLGEDVGAGLPSAFHALPSDRPKNRLGLGEWLVSRDNPLTARVMVNRFWEQLFGLGIVRSIEEFGSQGDLPTHPELLDWLAVEFMDSGWDVKALLRRIVTTAAYRQSSRVGAESLAKDPDNRLLSRGPRLRLGAEMVRDHALAVSGLLNPKMYGPPVRPPKPSSGLSAAFGGSLDWKTSTDGDQHRRGIYTEWRRTSPYPSMTTFDAPNREVCALRRNKSNTPLQALVTLNDPVFIEAAQGLARRMIAAGPADADRLRQGFRLCLSRAPSAAELARLETLRGEARAEFTADPKRAADFATLPIGPAPSGVAVPDLAAWTAVANVLLNLDETLMKR